MTAPGARLEMSLPALAAPAPFALPAGYAFRDYRPGDEAVWLELVRRAFDDTPVEPDRFSHAFGEAPRELPARMVFLIDPQGTPVGTSTAWFNRNRGGALVGRIHYVAIAPTHQGRGLAKPLVAETLRRMHARGHDRAYLVTESHRFPAIRVYLDFGFRPDPQGPDDERIWADVLRQLGRAV